MTNRILLPTDSSLPALVTTIKAVDMAKASGSTLLVLNVIEHLPSVEQERVDVNSALELISPSHGDLVLARNRRHESANKRYLPVPGRGARYDIASSVSFSGSIRSARIGTTSNNNAQEFDENE
jgi:nucleotide-binding universal stress UspA family protein